MKEEIACLSWSLDIVCPFCKEIIDLTGDMNYDGQFSTPIFNNKWGDLDGYEIECPECDKEFKIKRVEY